MSRRTVILTASLSVGLTLSTSITCLSQTVKPGAPNNVAICNATIRNPNLIGYTVDTDDARCCHGSTGSERAFVVDVATQKSVEIGTGLKLPPRTTQFDDWLPCREVAVITVGTPDKPARPAVPTCGNSKCYDPTQEDDAYFVDIRTGEYWSPIWSGGPFQALGKSNRQISPIYEGNKLKGYLMVADGTLLTMLPDGSAKAKAPVPADGHGCSFAKDMLSCQVGSTIQVFDSHFNAVSTIQGPLTLPYGRWAPDGRGFLFLDGLRPNPHYVAYWNAKDKQTYHLGPNVDYDIDCELNGNCFGFMWGSELPDWSPDGTRAYFSVPSPTDKSKRILGWVDVTNSQTAKTFHPLTDKFGRSARYPSVAPDGKSVTFVSISENPSEGRIQLFVLHLADGKIIQVTHVAKGYIVGDPHWQ